MARLTRFVLYTLVLGGALVLLAACARQGQPTATPTPAPPVVATESPAFASWPSPAPSVEPAGEPLAPSPTGTEPEPATADLAIQGRHGETGVYTLTVRNLGPDPATGIVLSDQLPEGATPRWTEPAQPVCGRQGRDVGCDLGDLQAGDAATVTLDLSVAGNDSLIEGLILGTEALITGNEGLTTSNEALITSTQLAGVTLTLSVPACALDRETHPPQVTCRLDRLRPGAEAHVRVGLDLEPGTTGPLVHTATVTANGIDPDPSNNRETITFTAGIAGPLGATVVPTTPLVIQPAGPDTVVLGQPFTYTYVVSNPGPAVATDAWFVDVVPSDLDLVAYGPEPPRCEQQGDTVTCALRDPDSGQAVTLTLVITGHGGQPMQLGIDPLLPGWPVCWVIKEQTWLHVVQCQLGDLEPGQATHVQLAFVAIGVVERTTVNTATVYANALAPSPVVSTSTVTITIQAGVEPGQP